MGFYRCSTGGPLGNKRDFGRKPPIKRSYRRTESRWSAGVSPLAAGRLAAGFQHVQANLLDSIQAVEMQRLIALPSTMLYGQWPDGGFQFEFPKSNEGEAGFRLVTVRHCNKRNMGCNRKSNYLFDYYHDDNSGCQAALWAYFQPGLSLDLHVSGISAEPELSPAAGHDVHPLRY
jgi:hypothetical protein